MPVDTVFSLIGKVKDAIFLIMDHLDKLKLSDNVVVQIMESLEYLQLTIKKIEPRVQKDSDTKEIKNFLIHLEKVKESCRSIEEKNTLVKLATAPGVLVKLHTIKAEVEMANDKLVLFITSNNLTMFCDTAKFQNRELKKIAASQVNNRVGLNIVADKSVKPPSAPPGLTIKENKNKFILSWKPCYETVEDYEVCFDEHEKSILSVGKVTTVEIGSPKVSPGYIYTMKVRGMNKGGEGTWSNSVVGQFTKPFPQQPEISNLFLRSTIAVVTVNIPKVVCSTESPVTCVEVSYVSTTDTEWIACKFTIKPTNYDTRAFTLRALLPNMKYNFRVRTMNTEGWSEPSEPMADTTLTLPSKPSKPDPPIIKVQTSTKVALEVNVPENTCGIKSPIIEWKVSGDVHKSVVVHETDIMEKSHIFFLSDLNPEQKYTLQLFAKNENEWSEPSKQFTVWIAIPSVPKDMRVSSKRSHSLIKIRWKAPDSSLITHYEIMKRTKKGNYSGNPIVIPAKKLSATFTKLKQNTHYCFKIRTCNGSYVSGWKEIEAHTRIHKAFKAAATPVVWALGTVGAPIITPVVTGGVAAIDRETKKGAVAAGAAGAVGGAVGGLVGAPVVGGIVTHAFLHGIDILSDQSDDEYTAVIEN